MGRLTGEQASESKKVRLRRLPVPVAAPEKRPPNSARQPGTLWQRKMRTLALRRPKGRTRRHSGGAPMKRG
ncbi:MAG: hypothetical protein HY598_02115 [Candidatus Omnitrophica bacterium]|nr:hypothetical protein [Candidatus Omnitrophota bacterium]